MQDIITANLQNQASWINAQEGKLAAALCIILFPDWNSPRIVCQRDAETLAHVGNQELRDNALIRAMLEHKKVTPDLINRICTDFLSMP